MGEYATYNGNEIKIGTCENMYYLRADQAALVTPKRGSVDPIKDAKEIRFRFPFPWEDDVEPGEFDDFDASFPVWGVPPTEGVEHGTVQFKARNGYFINLPCPEGPDAPEGIHRNGYGGAVRIVQQRVWDGHLATVLVCGGCGRRWRLETLADAKPVIDSLRAEARGHRHGAGVPEIADRIEAGYTQPLPF